MTFNRTPTPNPNVARYYQLGSQRDYEDLIDFRKNPVGNPDEIGVEVFFIKGHTIKMNGIDEMFVGKTMYNRGIVVTKFGNLNRNTNPVYNHRVFAHEVLH